MSNKKLRYRIGVFVLTAFIALAVLVYIFGLFPSLLRARGGNTYTVEFTDAPNLKEHTPVRRSGVKVGRVEKLDLDDETGKVIVVIRLEKRYALHQDEEPTVTCGLLSGDTFVDIKPKPVRNGLQLDHALVRAGSRLQGRVAPSVVAAVEPAQETLVRIRQTLERFEKLIPVTEDTLKEYRALAQDIRPAIPELRRTNEELRKLIQSANETMPDVRRLIKSAADTMPDVQKLVKSANETMPEIQRLVKGLNETVPDVQKMFKSINEMMPTAKETLKELQLATQNWKMVGERLNVLIRTNEDTITSLLKNSDQAAANIGDTFNQENRNNISTVLRNLGTSSKKFPSLTDETELFLRSSRSSVNKLNDTLKRLDTTLDALNRGSQPSTPQEAGLIRSLQQNSETLNRTLTDLNVLLRAAAQGDGTVRRFLADPALYNHLDDAALMLSRVVPRLDRVLKDLEVFADKLARHPESIGLGGVVRPSSGIKDPPSRIVPYQPPH
jgi:ABC-type transporter Mla subunit MlaD